MEKKDRLPGLIHDVKFRCPKCDNFTIAREPANDQNVDKQEYYCNGECKDDVYFNFNKFYFPGISGPGAGPAPPFTPPSEGERRLTTAKISNHLSPVEPEQCEIMISFNDGTAGEVAENLAHYLTS